MNELEALNLALDREKEAYRYYSDAAAKSTSAASKKTLSWLASEEEGHIKILQKLCGELQSSGRWLSEDEWCACADISNPVQCSEFPPSTETKGELQEDTEELQILKHAINDEREATTFYADLAKKTTEPDGKAMLEKLSEIEQGHLELLEEEYQWVSKSKSMFTLHRFSAPAR